MGDWKPDEKFFEFLRDRVDKDLTLKRLVMVIVNENPFNLEGILGEMRTGTPKGRLMYGRLYPDPEKGALMGDKYKEYSAQNRVS